MTQILHWFAFFLLLSIMPAPQKANQPMDVLDLFGSSMTKAITMKVVIVELLQLFERLSDLHMSAVPINRLKRKGKPAPSPSQLYSRLPSSN